jgi:hypothetical protein
MAPSMVFAVHRDARVANLCPVDRIIDLDQRSTTTDPTDL